MSLREAATRIRIRIGPQKPSRLTILQEVWFCPNPSSTALLKRSPQEEKCAKQTWAYFRSWLKLRSGEGFFRIGIRGAELKEGCYDELVKLSLRRMHRIYCIFHGAVMADLQHMLCTPGIRQICFGEEAPNEDVANLQRAGQLAP